MALTNAQKQARWRKKRDALAQANPDVLEQQLLLEVEQSDQMTDQERIALAEKIADLAKDFLWRAHRLSRMAVKLRTGEDHPLQR